MNAQPSIRQASETDLPDILSLLPASTSGVLEAMFGKAGIERRLSRRDTVTGLRSCTVACIDEVVVGHQISFDDAAARREAGTAVRPDAGGLLDELRRFRPVAGWYVSSLAVAAEHRRCGIGQRLLRTAAVQAKAAGIPVICLHVFAEKAAAMSLYEKAGFGEAGRVRLPLHPAIVADSELILMAAPVAEVLARCRPD